MALNPSDKHSHKKAKGQKAASDSKHEKLVGHIYSASDGLEAYTESTTPCP